METTTHGYSMKLEPARLRVGTPFHILTPGALIAVAGVAAGAVEIIVDGEALAAAEALEAVPARDGATRDDIDLPPAEVRGRLRPQLGAGRFTLRAATPKEAGPLVLYVEEPESKVCSWSVSNSPASWSQHLGAVRQHSRPLQQRLRLHR